MSDSQIDRRSFVKNLGLLATAMLISPKSGKSFVNKNSSPNIIFILADDLGYGDLGCYGQTKIKTPNLDKMAQEGLRFTSAYSGSPVCAPSRNCLMTGQHTGHTTVRQNKSDLTDERVPLLPEDTTVAEILKKAGYATGMIGKWGLGEPGTSGEPNKKGFDYFFGYLNQNHAHFYYPEFLYRNREKIFYDDNKDGKRGTYSYDLFEKEALDFIEVNKNKPFFLYLPFTTPHAELLVPEDSLNEYKGKFIEDKPYINNGKSGYATQMTPHAAYAAMITRMDRGIGRIFEKLKTLGLDENTIVFFTSDNGPSDAGGIDAEFFNSAGPLRGAKHDLYEGGIRVPSIVRWPGVVAPGTTSEQPWAFCDFLPTVADLVNINSPEEIDGISILPAILGKNKVKREHLYWEIKVGNKNFLQAVRIGNWKAIRSNPDSPVELYDLSIDLAEKNNVAEKNPDIIEQAIKLFDESHFESQHWPMSGFKNRQLPK